MQKNGKISVKMTFFPYVGSLKRRVRIVNDAHTLFFRKFLKLRGGEGSAVASEMDLVHVSRA